MPLTLVVLAAGIGSRYGGLKQIDPVGPSGEFVIDYSVYDGLRSGFDRVVFVIRREIDRDFRSAIGARFEKRVAVDYVYQELDVLPKGFAVPSDRVKPWGTGHAVLMCKDAVAGPFAVINADDFYGRQSFQVLAQFLSQRTGRDTRYSMVGFELQNTLSDHGHVARGICEMDSKGHLKSLVERTRVEKVGGHARFASDDGQWHSLTGRETASMNMWGFTPTIFGYLEEEFPLFLAAAGRNPKAEFFMPTVADTLIRSGRATVEVLNTAEKWFGVTYPADKPVVAAGIRGQIGAGVYPTPLWSRA